MTTAQMKANWREGQRNGMDMSLKAMARFWATAGPPRFYDEPEQEREMRAACALWLERKRRMRRRAQ